MPVNLGALGQMCALCGRPVGAPSGIIIPGQASQPSVTCSGHNPEEALQILLQRVMHLEQALDTAIRQLNHLTAVVETPTQEVTLDVPEGMTDEEAIELMTERVADAIERDSS